MKTRKLIKLVVRLEIPVWVTPAEQGVMAASDRYLWDVVRDRAELELRLHGEEYIRLFEWGE